MTRHVTLVLAFVVLCVVALWLSQAPHKVLPVDQNFDNLPAVTR